MKWPKARKNDFLFKKLKNNKMSVNLTLSSFSLYPPLQTSATISPKKKKKTTLSDDNRVAIAFYKQSIGHMITYEKSTKEKNKTGPLNSDNIDT